MIRIGFSLLAALFLLTGPVLGQDPDCHAAAPALQAACGLGLGSELDGSREMELDGQLLAPAHLDFPHGHAATGRDGGNSVRARRYGEKGEMALAISVGAEAVVQENQYRAAWPVWKLAHHRSVDCTNVGDLPENGASQKEQSREKGKPNPDHTKQLLIPAEDQGPLLAGTKLDSPGQIP
ncbi:hypothetical protein ACFL3S_07670 [Gemmatimonadota bacterium]